MADWADDAFDEIYRSILNDHLEVSKPLTLEHLCKAKADGYREAAQWTCVTDQEYQTALHAADKIEKGESNG